MLFFVNTMSETLFLPPSIPSKWRGLRGLAVQLARGAEALEGDGHRLRGLVRGRPLQRLLVIAVKHILRE